MFDEKLKHAMDDLKINQSKLSALTGIGKSSISQYLSGKNVPTEARQREIAESLGLDPEYFNQDVTIAVPLDDSPIKKLLPEHAAKLMGISKDTVRKGLQDGIFPWGYAVQTSSNRWTYFINAKRFAEIERMDLGLSDK